MKRFIAGLVIFFFSINSFISPQTAYASLTPSKQTNQPIQAQSIQISQDLGEVSERYQGEGNRLVVFIQDAHSDYNAQKSIQAIIRDIRTLHGIDAIGVEGARGVADLSPIRNLTNDKAKEDVLGFYLKEALFTGAGTEAMTSKDPYYFAGLEDWELYQKDLEAAREIHAQKEEIQKALFGLRTSLLAEKKKILNKDLYEADRLSEKILPYSESDQLAKNAPELFKQLKQKHIDTLDLTQFEAFRKVVDIYSRIHEDRLSGELEQFRKANPSYEFSQDPKKALEEFQTQDISVLKLIPYSNLKYYQEYHLARKSLNAVGLFSEVKGALERLKDKLTRNDAERALIAKWEDYNRLDAILNLQTTRGDLAQFQNLNPLGGFDALREKALASYRVAEQREGYIVSNLELLLKDHSAAFLILGGFHREGTTARLKEKKISYIVISPRFKPLDITETLYQARLSGNTKLLTSLRVPPLKEFDPIVLQEAKQAIELREKGLEPRAAVREARAEMASGRLSKSAISLRRPEVRVDSIIRQVVVAAIPAVAGGMSGIGLAVVTRALSLGTAEEFAILRQAAFIPEDVLKSYETAQVPDDQKIQEAVQREVVRLEDLQARALTDPEGALADILKYRTELKTFMMNHLNVSGKYVNLAIKSNEVKAEIERIKGLPQVEIEKLKAERDKLRAERAEKERKENAVKRAREALVRTFDALGPFVQQEADELVKRRVKVVKTSLEDKALTDTFLKLLNDLPDGWITKELAKYRISRPTESKYQFDYLIKVERGWIEIGYSRDNGDYPPLLLVKQQEDASVYAAIKSFIEAKSKASSLGTLDKTALQGFVTQIAKNTQEMKEKVVISFTEDMIREGNIDPKELEFILKNKSTILFVQWTKTERLSERMEFLAQHGLPTTDSRNFLANTGMSAQDISKKLAAMASAAEIGKEHVVTLTLDNQYRNDDVQVLNATNIKTPLFIAHYLAQIEGALKHDDLGIFKIVNGQFIATIANMLAEMISQELTRKETAKAA